MEGQHGKMVVRFDIGLRQWNKTVTAINKTVQFLALLLQLRCSNRILQSGSSVHPRVTAITCGV